MIRNKRQKNSGYALIELLFYISIFVVTGLVVINAMIIMTNAFKTTTINNELLESGNIMEKLAREIKASTSVIVVSSSDIQLNITDQATGIAETEEFILSGNNLQFYEGGVLTGNLNTPNINVTSLSFTQITTTNSTAVKIALTVATNRFGSTRSETFYDTLVLRGSY